MMLDDLTETEIKRLAGQYENDLRKWAKKYNFEEIKD